MNGSEGGIPFRTPSRPRIYHASAGPIGFTPLCGVRGHIVFSTRNPEQVTCPDCRRLQGG